MKKVILILSAIMMAAIMLSSCGGGVSKEEGASKVEYAYSEVTIGEQVWMTKNLNVDTFRNGDPIPEAKTDEEWEKAGENGRPAWCYYDNDPANGEKYGKLYNWYAIKDPRGLAPKGWHVPHDAEWTRLTDYLGGKDAAGSKMKSSSGWAENGSGTNESGFTGLPGGFRGFNGSFYRVGENGYWWSTNNVRYRYLSYSDGNVERRTTGYKEKGYSVRCLMYTEKGASKEEGASKEVTIGYQVWMTKNLNVDKFRNGDPIPEAKTDEEWEKAGENGDPAWCYYDNDPANGEKYGKLYNWYAIKDPRGLAPKGWHVPHDAEWTQLTDYLGGKDAAGNKMKSSNGLAENGNDSNESGFSGLPGGYRNNDGTFYSIGKNGNWWSSTERFTSTAWHRNLHYISGNVTRYDINKGLGYSVRCLRD